MPWSWLIWLIGLVLLLLAGFGAALLSGRRVGDLRRRTTWSSAHAAIASATVSRDACRESLPEAEQLLARAELLAADRGGADAARMAARSAERADRLWREAGDA